MRVILVMLAMVVGAMGQGTDKVHGTPTRHLEIEMSTVSPPASVTITIDGQAYTMSAEEFRWRIELNRVPLKATSITSATPVAIGGSWAKPGIWATRSYDSGVWFEPRRCGEPRLSFIPECDAPPADQTICHNDGVRKLYLAGECDGFDKPARRKPTR